MQRAFVQQRTNSDKACPHILQVMEQQADRLVGALLDDSLPPGLAGLDRSMTTEQATVLKRRQELQVVKIFVDLLDVLLAIY